VLREVPGVCRLRLFNEMTMSGVVLNFGFRRKLEVFLGHFEIEDIYERLEDESSLEKD